MPGPHAPIRQRLPPAPADRARISMPGPHAPIRLCLPPAPADRARISMPGPHAPIRLRLPPVPAARADVSVPGPPAPIRLRVRPVPAARTEISAPGPHAPIRLNLRPVPAARLSHRNRTETSVRLATRDADRSASPALPTPVASADRGRHPEIQIETRRIVDAAQHHPLHPAAGHAPPPGRFSSERESHHGIRHQAGHASGQSQFFLRPLRQASRLDAGRAVGRAARPQPPRRGTRRRASPR